MAGSKKNTASGLAKTDDVTGSRSGQDTILADEELLDTVASTNFGNQLDNFRVPVASITTNHKE